jgi:hypothetical protein
MVVVGEFMVVGGELMDAVTKWMRLQNATLD